MRRSAKQWMRCMVVVSVLASGSVRAQTAQTIELTDSTAGEGRSYLLELNANASYSLSRGGWTNGSHLQNYARAHKGENFLIFEQAGLLYRLDSPAALAELQRLQEPLDELAEIQRTLAAQQAPLAEQQRALSTQMGAIRNLSEMSRIGRSLGSVGRRQGEIGREQGAIGRQQGVLGRAVYQSAQAMIDKCLGDGSCKVVAPAAPTTAQQ